MGLVNGRDFVLLKELCKLGARAELFGAIQDHLSFSWQRVAVERKVIGDGG